MRDSSLSADVRQVAWRTDVLVHGQHAERSEMRARAALRGAKPGPRCVPSGLQCRKTVDAMLRAAPRPRNGPGAAKRSRPGRISMWLCPGFESEGLHGRLQGLDCFFPGQIDVASIKSDGYSFQVEMNYRAAGRGLKIAEVPIHFEERAEGASRMNLHEQIESALTPWKLTSSKRVVSTAASARRRRPAPRVSAALLTQRLLAAHETTF